MREPAIFLSDCMTFSRLFLCLKIKDSSCNAARVIYTSLVKTNVPPVRDVHTFSLSWLSIIHMSMHCLAGERLGSSLCNICVRKYAMSCGWLVESS